MHVALIQRVQIRLLLKIVLFERSLHLIAKGSPPASVGMVNRHIATSIAKCGYTALASKIPYYKQNNHNQATVPFTAVNGALQYVKQPTETIK